MRLVKNNAIVYRLSPECVRSRAVACMPTANRDLLGRPKKAGGNSQEKRWRESASLAKRV